MTRFLNGVTVVISIPVVWIRVLWNQLKTLGELADCCVHGRVVVGMLGIKVSTPLMDCTHNGEDLAIGLIRTNISVCWIVAHEGSGHDCWLGTVLHRNIFHETLMSHFWIGKCPCRQVKDSVVLQCLVVQFYWLVNCSLACLSG